MTDETYCRIAELFTADDLGPNYLTLRQTVARKLGPLLTEAERERDAALDDLTRCREDDLFHAHRRAESAEREVAALRLWGARPTCGTCLYVFRGKNGAPVEQSWPHIANGGAYFCPWLRADVPAHDFGCSMHEPVGSARAGEQP